jgi:choline dehydrogenase-like flavoprotein
VLLRPALATKRLTILTRAMAREITVDDQGLASGVSYIDKSTGREHHVRGRIIVLAASACESARLLLNSKSSKFPQGLANSSGVVGRYLTDTTGTAVRGFIPKMMSSVPHNEDGASGAHLYMPWWLDNRKLDFPRGYHIEIGGGRRMPGLGTFNGVHLYNGAAEGRPIAGGGYGRQLKDDYRRFYGATVAFAGRGEMVPNKDSYCEIDPAVVDQWGIPVLRFRWKWTDHEYKQVKHMQDTFRAIIEEMGGTPLSPMPSAEAGYGIENGGRIIHEVGTTRMGNDPSTSVVNRDCQAHDVRNLFITDGGPFVSNPHKNVTWTILALSMRASERIAERRNKGEL